MFKILSNPDLLKKTGAILFLLGLLLNKFTESISANIGLVMEIVGGAILIYWGLKFSDKNKYIYLLYLLIALCFIAYPFFS